MLATFPAELIDAITEYLRHDVHALANCSLVCRAWLPWGRAHLFNLVDLSVKLRRVDAFLSLLRSPNPTFLHCVRWLKVRDGLLSYEVAWVEQALPLLQKLENVETLGVWQLSWDSLGGEARNALLHGFMRVSTLEIRNSHFATDEQIINFITAFPLLRNLSINVVRWSATVPWSDAAFAKFPPPHLETLSLGSCPKQHILEWLMSGNNSPKSNTIYFHSILSGEGYFIGRYLVSLGPSLQHLRLEFGGLSYDEIGAVVDQYIKLLHNTELRSLTLDSQLSMTRTWGWVLGILNQIASPHIQHISMKMLLSHPYAIKSFDWSAMEQTLLQPHFLGLRGMHCVVQTQESLYDCNVPEAITQKWPLLHERGILRFAIKDSAV
jgi:hypothetical protein